MSPSEQTISIEAGPGRVSIDPETGCLTALDVPPNERRLVDGHRGQGLLRVAVPLDDFPAHSLDVGLHGRPTLVQRPGGITLTYSGMTSGHADLDIETRIDLDSTDAGLVLRARVQNRSEVVIPQVAFPQLLGLDGGDPGPDPFRGRPSRHGEIAQRFGPGTDGAPADDADVPTLRLQLPGRRMQLSRELVMRPDDLTHSELPLQSYFWYGSLDFNMKWLDYGDADGGVTLYSRNPEYRTQGLVVERRSRGENRYDLRWVHYPFIAPGESWDSGDYVLLAHRGDWYEGAKAYQSFTSHAYPYQAPTRIREALAVRSVWPAVRSNPPTFTFPELTEYAREIADPALGVAELVFWHWWRKNGYPFIDDERLGSSADLDRALADCRQLGVPVSMFVSHHILRDTDETDPAWLHRNAGGQVIGSNWTYGPGFLPRFPSLFYGSHALLQGSALSTDWCQTGLAEYQRLLARGADGICFDQFYAWREPNFSPDANGPADGEGDALLSFGRQARAMIRHARPEGSFSGEWVSDLKVPVLDYTWDWRNAFEMPDVAPFRYVFPQFRLNANVGEHPRGAVLGFMEGALLNLMPGDMRSDRLSEHPELVALLRRLNALRRRFLTYFVEGQFRYLEGLTVRGCEARLYTLPDRAMVVVANPSDAVVDGQFTLDLAAVGYPDGASVASEHRLDGTERPVQPPGGLASHRIRLGPDELAVVEYRH